MDTSLLGIPVLSFISAGAGAYIGAYLKKKGEDRAAQENHNELVEQMRVMTQATKKIEAEILDSVWNRQKQWEFKRERLLELARATRDFHRAILHISGKVKGLRSSEEEQAELEKALTTWSEASAKFDLEAYLASLVLDGLSVKALHDLIAVLRIASDEILDENNPGALANHHKKMLVQLEEIRILIRRELGMSIPRSSVSSAVPTPAPPTPEANTP